MYYTLITALGARLLANAQAAAQPLQLTHMAVGDGDGNPEESQTALKSQRYKAQINSLSIDQNNANQLIAELMIPEDVGGWYVREVGLFAEDGTLFAAGSLPESFKPLIASGSSRTQTVRMVIAVSNAEHITLKIDPSVVLATRQWVEKKTASAITSATTAEAGIVKLSNATNSEDETIAATAKAVKQAYDKAVEAMGGRLDASTLAQQLQAKADKSHNHRAADITDFTSGVAAAFAQSLSANGWCKLPNGLILQWGHVEYRSGNQPINYPVVFPQYLFSVSVTLMIDRNDADHMEAFGVYNQSTAGFTLFNWVNPCNGAYWIALGV